MTEPNVITYSDAATLAKRSVSTIYRWVKAGEVRVAVLPDKSGWGVSRRDVERMATKRWTRKPRHSAKPA